MVFYGDLSWEFMGSFMGFTGIYPLVNIQTAIENGPVEIVDLLIKNGDFQ